MKLYLVIGWTDEPTLRDEATSIYGIFSNESRANEIKKNLCKSIEDYHENEEVFIKEVDLDQPTEEYYFMMNN